MSSSEQRGRGDQKETASEKRPAAAGLRRRSVSRLRLSEELRQLQEENALLAYHAPWALGVGVLESDLLALGQTRGAGKEFGTRWSKVTQDIGCCILTVMSLKCMQCMLCKESCGNAIMYMASTGQNPRPKSLDFFAHIQTTQGYTRYSSIFYIAC